MTSSHLLVFLATGETQLDLARVLSSSVNIPSVLIIPSDNQSEIHEFHKEYNLDIFRIGSLPDSTITVIRNLV